MFLISWNVAGWSTTSQAIRDNYGSLTEFFKYTQADIICLQETKVSRERLNSDPASVGASDPISLSKPSFSPPPVVFSSPCRNSLPAISDGTAPESSRAEAEKSGPPAVSGGVAGWESFWAHSAKQHRGLNGVATFARTGCTLACDSRPFQDDALDGEGRCIVTYHSAVIVVNVYVPNARGGTRMAFKMKFLRALQGLLGRLRRGEGSTASQEGRKGEGKPANALTCVPRPVILVGDLNLTYRAMDATWWFRRIELRQLLLLQQELLRVVKSEREEKGSTPTEMEDTKEEESGNELTEDSYYIHLENVNAFIACVQNFLAHHAGPVLQFAKKNQWSSVLTENSSHTVTSLNGAEDCPVPLSLFSSTDTSKHPSIALDSNTSSSLSSLLNPDYLSTFIDPSALELGSLEKIVEVLSEQEYVLRHPYLMPSVPLPHSSSSLRFGSCSPSCTCSVFSPSSFPSCPVSLSEWINAGFTSVNSSDFMQGNAGSSFHPHDTAWNKYVVYPVTRYTGLPPHSPDTIHFISDLLQSSFPASTAKPKTDGRETTQQDRMWDTFLLSHEEQQEYAKELGERKKAPLPASYPLPYCPAPFTCWDQQRNRRHSNEGTRLDYILVDHALMPLVVCRDTTENNTGPLPLLYSHPPDFSGNRRRRSASRAGFALRVPEEDRVSPCSFWGEYGGGSGGVGSGLQHQDSVRRAIAAGAYPPAPYDGSGLPPLSLHAREHMWRGLPSTGLFVTPPQYSDHCGVCLLLRDPSGALLSPRMAGTAVRDLHPPCAYVPPRSLFSFMQPLPHQSTASAASSRSRENSSHVNNQQGTTAAKKEDSHKSNASYSTTRNAVPSPSTLTRKRSREEETHPFFVPFAPPSNGQITSPPSTTAIVITDSDEDG